MRITNVKGIDVDLSITKKSRIDEQNQFYMIELVFVRFEFYVNERRITSCRDMILANLTTPTSLFQFSRISWAVFFKCHFKQPICPLVFNNMTIERLILFGMVNTFFKKSMIQFTNETFQNLETHIKSLTILRSDNVIVDSRFLNPLIFKDIYHLFFYGSIKKIEQNVFTPFQSFYMIQIQARHFRALIHRQGIEWIKDMKLKVNIDLNNETELGYYFSQTAYVYLNIRVFPYTKTSELFPDEDFCLYVDYPFRQLAILMIYVEGFQVPIPDNFRLEFTCTYIWLTQYFAIFEKIFDYGNFLAIAKLNRESSSIRPTCNLTRMSDLCRKSNFKIKAI